MPALRNISTTPESLLPGNEVSFATINKFFCTRLTRYYYQSNSSGVTTFMSKPAVHRLGDLQLKIMKSLWQRQAATVADVHEDLGGNEEMAYTTVATMLRKMEVRGLVGHRQEGRSFIYTPAIGAEEVHTSMADHLVDRLFEGSLAGMVSHLLTSRDVSRDELDELEQLIAKRKRQR
jgi:BlaI family penicillinase repressor